MNHLPSDTSKPCPACDKNVPAHKTLVGQTDLLCDTHREQLDNHLGHILSKPDQPSTTVDNTDEVIKNIQTKKTQPDQSSDWLDRILDELVTSIHNLLPGDVGSMDRVLIPLWIARAAIQSHLDTAVREELEELSMAVIQPCEPDCTPVRHALHEGSWRAHLVIESRLAHLTKDKESK